RGARGLKRGFELDGFDLARVAPTRGAWIETLPIDPPWYVETGRAPRGARGLKRQIRLKSGSAISPDHDWHESKR
ncbi:MAG TPA: hypothetical protein VHI52_10280, partial [Verrucomicrobiae bacterium]|nr:hypothetical protein [Verrucomicrobiae bacterium]